MPTTKIVLASILKPVDDTRMFEKIGHSLDETNKYDINIIGFSTKNAANPDPIHWYPLFDFKRTSLRRWWAPWKVWRNLIKLKPDLVIINTPELLTVMAFYKLFFRAKIIYDVIENYKYNVLYTTTYPKMLRPLIANWVRCLEYLSRLWIDHYFVAEKNYATELGFIKNKYTLIENKYRPPEDIQILSPVASRDRIKIIYSGTIATHYGIFESLEFAEQLHNINPNTQLTIIGFAPDHSLMPRIKEKISDKPYIDIIGGDVLVPHQQLIQAISESDIGLVPYLPNKSTFGCIPTKIYEYLAHRLPIILQENPLWVEFCQRYNACLPINFQNYDMHKLWQTFQNTEFYNASEPLEVYWKSEEKPLIDVVERFV